MNALRQHHGIGRLLAAWLLLWFGAMSATPPAPPRGVDHAGAGCMAHHAHSGDHSPACVDDLGDAHAQDPSHCPVCLHAAAPPPPQRVLALPHGLPGDPPEASFDAFVPPRTAAPPPARGPPRFA